MTDHDTETRLRDYLHTKAQVVPDHATPPEPVASVHRPRRTWPVLAAAASMAAVLALAVPYLGGLGSDDPPVSAGGGLSSLKVPYILTEGPGSRTLHDGTTTIPLGNGPARDVVARLATGWLVVTAKTDAGKRVTLGHAVLTKDGRLRPVGPSNAMQNAILSPDRKQVAILGQIAGGSFKIEVIDLATGNKTADLPLPSLVALHAWSKHGIWYDDDTAANPQLWQPGEQPREVEIPGFTSITAPGTTDRMLIRTQRDGCVKVMTMDESGELTTLRENCDSTSDAGLSPDGKVLVIPELQVAVNVDSGEQTPLPDLSNQSVGLVFEDDRTVLAMATLAVSESQPTPTTPIRTLEAHQLLKRCDVLTGTCEKVFERLPGTDDPTIGIGQP